MSTAAIWGPVFPPLKPTSALPLGWQPLGHLHTESTSLCASCLSPDAASASRAACPAGEWTPAPSALPWPCCTHPLAGAARTPLAGPLRGAIAPIPTGGPTQALEWIGVALHSNPALLFSGGRRKLWNYKLVEGTRVQVKESRPSPYMPQFPPQHTKGELAFRKML